MSNSMDAHDHVYLVQPLDKKSYKEMIVFASSKEQARTSAAKLAVSQNEKTSKHVSAISVDIVYLNEDMSICIEIDPDIVKVDGDYIRVKYNEIIYDLIRNVAQEVIAESVYK